MEQENEQMNKIENTSPLYPYNGRALNLIDKFYIFGYNYLTLKKYLIDETPKISEIKLDSEGFGSFKLKEEPSTLSEISHDYNKEIIDNESIKKLIYPNDLFILFSIKEKENIFLRRQTLIRRSTIEFQGDPFTKIEFSESKNECSKEYKVFFSITPMEGNTGRKCQNGFAYTFYRKFWKTQKDGDKEYSFYIPYTFCIISEYPYYRSYERLFRCISMMFAQQSTYIPIEILLYKIISLTPSPINTDVILDLDLMCNQKKIFSHLPKRTITDKHIMFTPSLSSNVKPKINKFLPDDFDIIEEGEIPSIDMIQKIKDEPYVTKIKFKYLSGYPLIQYNLAKVLFHTLSINQIINIFLFSFLEQNIIFFSEDIEYLSLTINSYMNFNYPLNDAQYFYNMGIISLESFKNDDSIFGIKSFTSIIAINNKFVDDYMSKTSNIGGHIVVDLDKGDLKIAKENNEDDNNEKLNELINNILEDNADYKYLEKTYLYVMIKRLQNSLNEILKKKNTKNTFFSKEFTYFNDEPYSGSIEEINKSIQEAFYESILILSMYIYENILILEDDNKNIKKEEKKNFMKIEFNNSYTNKEKYKKEELLIIKELLESMKLKGSFDQFIMEHNPIDLYKIPLTFMDEFVSFIFKKEFNVKTKNIKYFDLIDELYNSRKLTKIKNINFNSDIYKYIENCRKKINREIFENDKKRFNHDDTIIVKIADYQNKKIIKYQTYELDDRILLKYIYIIKSLTEKQYSELISENLFKGENCIKKISITEVESRIENFCILDEFLSDEDLCCINIIILFSLSLKYFPEDFSYNTNLSVLLHSFFVFRKYISIFLQILYKLYMQALQEKKINTKNKLKLCFYFTINYIRIKNLFPNEYLMFIINKFFKSILDFDNDNAEDNEISIENNMIDNELIFKKMQKNIYISYNFSSVKSYDEKFIFDKLTKEKVDSFSINIGEKTEKIKPRIKYVFYKNNKINKIETNFLGQKEIYTLIINEYNKYYENLDFSILNYDKILYSCMNIFIYLRNNEFFKGSYEIKNIMENIFYIFTNINK